MIEQNLVNGFIIKNTTESLSSSIKMFNIFRLGPYTTHH